MSGEDVMKLFDEKGVTQYLTQHYGVLHTQGERWIVEEIEDFLQDK